MESSSGDVFCSAQCRLCLKSDGTLPYSVSYPVNITELQVSDLNDGYIGYYGICVEEITALMEKLSLGS